MTIKLLGSSLFGLLFVAACSSTTPAPSPSGNGNGNGNDTGNGDGTETARSGLTFVAPCTASACGEVPPSTSAPKPECSNAAGACGWADPDPNASVSYRQCEEKECGAKPDESVCPSGTTFKGAACGSENDGPCVWRSACAPPRSTTPCPDADGCGPMPMIGVICADGSNGELECMKVGNKCEYQRTCD
ncbi:MAG: hypothetical protein KF795_15995 [Labilithrix sp.]|nr:hypothetical protein [Labilithrix sp.]